MSPQTPPISIIGKSIIWLSSVDSTNNYAMARVKEGVAGTGTVYFAKEQTEGRGQRGKSWTTNRDENIIMSVVLETSFLHPSRQFLLSACIALGCYNFFKKYAGDEMTRVKWPNDLYWQDRKAGGILIESGVGSRESGVDSQKSEVDSLEKGVGYWHWAVVGIGININQTYFQSEILRPVSLKQITGRTFHVEDLVQELCECLDAKYRELRDGGASAIMEAYNSVLYKRDQSVRLKKGAVVFEATITGVNEAGRLQTRDAIEREFNSGEVEWLT